jgi:hypothetical protein
MIIPKLFLSRGNKKYNEIKRQIWICTRQQPSISNCIVMDWNKGRPPRITIIVVPPYPLHITDRHVDSLSLDGPHDLHATNDGKKKRERWFFIDKNSEWMMM